MYHIEYCTRRSPVLLVVFTDCSGYNMQIVHVVSSGMCSFIVCNLTSFVQIETKVWPYQLWMHIQYAIDFNSQEKSMIVIAGML